eukprot:scaffold1044_cov120-Isochrysis_galbana.AAC.31
MPLPHPTSSKRVGPSRGTAARAMAVKRWEAPGLGFGLCVIGMNAAIASMVTCVEQGEEWGGVSRIAGQP